MKRQLLFENFGLIFKVENGSILDITTNQLMATLGKYGMLVFQNHSVNLDIFTQFIAKHSTRVTCDPARKASSENAQLIDAGNVEMGLHVENGNLPFLPDVQWFYCEKAAKKGSQTTVCDGFKVWEDLSDSTKNKFITHRIKYSRNISAHLWKKYLSVEFEVPVEHINSDHLERVHNQVSGQKYVLNDDGSVNSEYKTWAVHKTNFSKQPAFANSMLGPSVNYEPPKITWEDGQIISSEIWEEIREITRKHTHNIEWQDGDVVIIDNSRVMHGRRMVEDMERRIYGGQSYLKF